MSSGGKTGYLSVVDMRMTSRAPARGDDLKELGTLRELIAKTRKTLGNIVALCISDSYGDAASRMANIALLASELIRELEAV